MWYTPGTIAAFCRSPPACMANRCLAVIYSRLTYSCRPASLKNSYEVRLCSGCDGISSSLSCFRGPHLRRQRRRLADRANDDHLTDRSTDLTNGRPGPEGPAHVGPRPASHGFPIRIDAIFKNAWRRARARRCVIYDRRAGSATISRSASWLKVLALARRPRRPRPSRRRRPRKSSLSSPHRVPDDRRHANVLLLLRLNVSVPWPFFTRRQRPTHHCQRTL